MQLYLQHIMYFPLLEDYNRFVQDLLDDRNVYIFGSNKGQ